MRDGRRPAAVRRQNITAGGPSLTGRCGFRRQRPCAFAGDQRHLQARRLRRARHHIAVAAVVAVAAAPASGRGRGTRCAPMRRPPDRRAASNRKEKYRARPPPRVPSDGSNPQARQSVINCQRMLFTVARHDAPLDFHQLAQHIKQWGQSLGFQQVGICDTDLSLEEPKLQARLDKQYHGEMEWMARHAARAPSRTVAGHAAGDQRTHELPAGQGGVCQHLAKSAAGLRQPLRAGARLSQTVAPAPEKLGDQIQPTAAS